LTVDAIDLSLQINVLGAFRTIEWKLFGGLDYMTLVASGQAASFGAAKAAACEAALVQALAAHGHLPKV
jgi:hypothetical protein